MQYLELPHSIAIGDFIAFVHERMTEEEGLKLRYTFSGSLYFKRMQEISLYSTNRTEIRERVAKAGLTDIFSTCLV